jgi:tetratricopeptide (TPR) repeat protein
MGTTAGRSFAAAIAALRVLLLLAASLSPGIVAGQAASAPPPASPAFDRGIEAFQAGDFPAALRLFLDAREAGLDTPGLRYNVGVTYYRLGNYPDAGREFRELARDPEWAALAHYNLGLAALRMGQKQRALEHFEHALHAGTAPNLRALAGAALGELRRALPPPTNAWVSLAGGYDSNATLSLDAETVGASGKSDLFLETFAAATHKLTGTGAHGLYADGSLVLRKYGDLDQFDGIGTRVGLTHWVDAGRRQRRFGGHFELSYVDDERLELAAVADLQLIHRLDAGGDWRGRCQLGRIDGGGAFSYLDGWRHRLTVDRGIALASAVLRVGYRLEYNDRKDLREGPEFSSYSPTRHMLFANVTWPELGAWRTDAGGDFQRSRYNDPHRLDGGTREITREDTRYGVYAHVSRPWAGAWRLFIDFSYYRNSSSLDAYDYNRHQLLAGSEAGF